MWRDACPCRHRAVRATALKFDAIIFDFDGVVVDSEVVANTILAEQVSALGLPTTYEEALERYCGRQWAHCVEIIEAELGGAVPADFLTGFYRRARARHIGTMKPVAGVEAFIACYGDRGRAIASSNDRQWLLDCLGRMNLASWFGAHVYSGADLERGKPHPDIFLHTAKALGVHPERALVIEDSAIGVEAGAAAGMTVVGLLAGGHIRDGHEAKLREAGAHHVVADYAGLERLIATLES